MLTFFDVVFCGTSHYKLVVLLRFFYFSLILKLAFNFEIKVFIFNLLDFYFFMDFYFNFEIKEKDQKPI